MSATLESVSPSDPSDVVGRFPSADDAAVADGVARAREAFPHWRDAGAAARAAVLERFARIASERAAELSVLIAREVGKARWDALAEARLLAPKVAVTLAEGMDLVRAHEAAPGQRATYRPRGVLAVCGPFNFPAHLPNGHIAPALATRNTVVFKPSAIAPAVGAWMAERWRDAGLPDGVLEVVQGGPETGRALARADVDGILFTGSYATGRALIEATLDAPQKLLALELGGSNAIIVCADADLDLAVSECALSIAATTGQRCTAARRIFVERPVREAFQHKLVAVLEGLRVTRGSSSSARSRRRRVASACCASTRVAHRPTRARVSCAASRRSSAIPIKGRRSSAPRPRCIRSTISTRRSRPRTTPTTGSPRR